MAIDAREIEAREFTISVFRGYKTGEVDDYLDEIAVKVDRLRAENRALEAEIATFRDRDRRVAELEQTLRDTLLTAQRAAEDVLSASREKAAAMIKDSELEGRRIVEESERLASGAAQKFEAISRDVAGVKALIRRILGEQMRLLEESYPEEKPLGEADRQAWRPPLAAPAKPASLPDLDRTQEFSAREVREQAMEEERADSPNAREY
jgi:cell division initiation protein